MCDGYSSLLKTLGLVTIVQVRKKVHSALRLTLEVPQIIPTKTVLIRWLLWGRCVRPGRIFVYQQRMALESWGPNCQVVVSPKNKQRFIADDSQ